LDTTTYTAIHGTWAEYCKLFITTAELCCTELGLVRSGITPCAKKCCFPHISSARECTRGRAQSASFTRDTIVFAYPHVSSKCSLILIRSLVPGNEQPGSRLPLYSIIGTLTEAPHADAESHSLDVRRCAVVPATGFSKLITAPNLAVISWMYQ
jgi:hypothetical protein